MNGEEVDERGDLARARWRSRRGMLELDFFLVPFADQVLPTLEARFRGEYSRLLACEDVEIHAWLTGKQPAPDAGLQEIVDRVRAHAGQPVD